ncbi:MAG: hypothetical protein FP820_02345 [Sulfurimonas sp.]|jgi:hypothetical protein|nr:hypothetical protein [Sulfurimonas sp.]MBU1217858.1 hypothetical protein [bacterium]MBU1433343.1 hypothetical protein [bacterium]MBU1503457.1 hypothetical protein [bacterium]MBU3938084.1 hypothetical protein [bacterium]
MRTILFILLLSVSLSAALPFTLENLKNLRIYFINKSDFINKQQEAELKEAIAKKLTAAGIVLNATDSSTFMIKIESVHIDTTYVVNVGIAVGEEIITKRKDAVQTLAFTYHANDFIDTKEPYIETLESVHYLVDDFIDLYNEDKE